jgi:hypothetical protein
MALAPPMVFAKYALLAMRYQKQLYTFRYSSGIAVTPV